MLNPSQTIAAQKIQEFLKGDKKYFKLAAPAGY